MPDEEKSLDREEGRTDAEERAKRLQLIQKTFIQQIIVNRLYVLDTTKNYDEPNVILWEAKRDS